MVPRDWSVRFMRGDAPSAPIEHQESRSVDCLFIFITNSGFLSLSIQLMTVTDYESSNQKDKTVQVYILMGQSNMLGKGQVGTPEHDANHDGTLCCACHSKGLYPYLLDAATNDWTTREDVRYVFTMGNGVQPNPQYKHNEWLTVHNGGTIGPEIGIGHVVGNHQPGTAPVLLLKTCIGNRSLGWDLLPPGSSEFSYRESDGVTWVHPGYHGSPEKWKQGTTPQPIDWYAGMQYDGDVQRAKDVLADIETFVPGATGYSIAGFFWWQGDKDSRNEGLADHYEVNLTALIRQLRVEFDTPKAPFVCATLGQTPINCDPTTCEGKILYAMLRAARNPEFQGNVSTVYTHPLSRGGSSGSHYNLNAETYMNVGEAMGQAMVELQSLARCNDRNSRATILQNVNT